MLKVWGRSNSTNVKKVLWTAGELGLEYEFIQTGGSFGGNREPDYLERNPNGLVPTIDDDGFILWESNTIVRYLAARAGNVALWIEDPKGRASAEKWMDWAASTIPGNFFNIMMHGVRLPHAERNTDILQKAVAAMATSLAIPDKVLAQQPWLSGDAFGIGDIPLAAYAYVWFSLALDRPALPHLEEWYERIKTRPAYRDAVMVPII